MVWDALVWLLVVAASIQLLYLGFLWRAHLGRHPYDGPPPGSGTRPAVSVVVCARNEAANLRTRLPAVLAQEYSAGGRLNYEVVVVDDGSDDGSKAVLTELAADYPHLRVIHLPPDFPKQFAGKKGALHEGVAASRHDVLLFTDADCLPASRTWIQELVAPLSPLREIVVGYGAYEPAPGTLNAFVRAETVVGFMNSYEAAAAGLPYMAVGRNLCVRKETFVRAQVHPLWTATTSGDDDLLMRICATAQNVWMTRAPAGFTYSPAKARFEDFAAQKRRHLSTGKYYRWRIKWLLGAIGFSHTIFWLAGLLIAAGLLAGYTLGALRLPVLLLIVVRTAGWNASVVRWTGRLQERGLWRFVPLADLLLAAYPLFFAPYIFWKNKQQWT